MLPISFSIWREAPVRTIIGRNYKFVSNLGEFIFKNKQVFASGPENADDCVAGRFQCFCDRQQRCIADAAADTDNRAKIFNMGRPAQRTRNVGNVIALLHIR